MMFSGTRGMPVNGGPMNFGASATELRSWAGVKRRRAFKMVAVAAMVAVSAGSLPETGKPTFELGDDEIEVGELVPALRGADGVDRATGEHRGA